MLKKIVEYNSSTSQKIAVSFIKAIKAFKPTQSVIATITNAPDTKSPETQEYQSGEQNEVEVADKAEAKPITPEGPEGNWKNENQAIAMLSLFGDHILYWLKVFPGQVLVKKIELKAIMEGSSLKTIAL